MKVRNSNARQVLLKLKDGEVVVIPPYAVIEVEDGVELPDGVYVIDSKVVKKDSGKDK